uniref:FBA_2 domain-containing protein n=1 Tax=Steinernema glaseri TaxID=37863 RepID=A0A1I7Y8K7_9BILA
MMRSMDAGRRAVNLSWKILKAAKKNAFAHVSLKHYKNGDPDEFADFAVDYVERGNSLEKLRCSGSFPHKKVIKAVAPLFGRYRGRPLAVEFPENPINPDLVRSIVDKWWDSNEIFEEKQIVWGWSRRSSVWNHIENKNKSKKKFNHKFTMRDLSTGYLAHHSRCSTLSISLYGICIEKLQPWHVPVDFMWINLLIAKWKEGNGFYVYEEERDIHFTWKSDDDWDKFKRKYQVQECEPDGYIRRIKFLTLTHRSELLKLNVIKCAGSFEIGVEHKWFSDSELMSLISDWQEGNGEALLNGQKVIEVRTYWNIFSDGSVVEYAHPNKNVRCVVARQARPKRVGYPDGFDFLVRISICPSDSQRV